MKEDGCIPAQERLHNQRTADGDVLAAIDARLLIYRTKRDQADPFADDQFNRRDYFGHTVEALEILRDEIVRATAP